MSERLFMEYRICSKCIMDNVADTHISFDEEGVCNHCRQFEMNVAKYPQSEEERKQKFDAIIKAIKEDGKTKEYDCVIGVSGGVDSAYLLHIAHNAGLRILAVHVDAGWNTDIAVENIKKLCSKLNIELHTIVIDWNTMKELQRAYMYSGLANLDVPQDHAFVAATYKFAAKHNIRYMLSGNNYATEGILPQHYGYAFIDYTCIKSVYRKCGRGRVSLRKYPKMSFFKYAMMFVGKTERIDLLNYVPYSKQAAVEFLHNEYGWNYYGGKHFESRFTKFFQSYYLPKKFGYDKKRAHIASLIVGGELSREQGLAEMEDTSSYTEEQMLEDRDYILKKLDISVDDWNKIMAAPNKTEDDYKNSKAMMKRMQTIKHKLRK